MARRRDKVWQEAGRFPHLREPPDARLRWPPGSAAPSGCPNIGRDRIDVVACKLRSALRGHRTPIVLGVRRAATNRPCDEREAAVRTASATTQSRASAGAAVEMVLRGHPGANVLRSRSRSAAGLKIGRSGSSVAAARDSPAESCLRIRAGTVPAAEARGRQGPRSRRDHPEDKGTSR
jgi:hypothetical protein